MFIVGCFDCVYLWEWVVMEEVGWGRVLLFVIGVVWERRGRSNVGFIVSRNYLCYL